MESLSKPTYREEYRMKTASEEVTDMIFLSKWSSQTLCAGAELGVFDRLSRDATRTASDIAAEADLDPRLLYRLLRALASLGLLRPAGYLNKHLQGHITNKKNVRRLVAVCSSFASSTFHCFPH